MADIHIKKGFNLTLSGVPERKIEQASFPKKVAVKPGDFTGYKPRLKVTVGDTVKAGSVLCYHKKDERIVLTSPVAGTVSEIIRGDRRSIEAIVVDTSGKKNSVDLKITNKSIASFKQDEIVQGLLKSGLFPFIKQRPFGTVANPDQLPRDIFISVMDTAPLAPSIDLLLDGQKDVFVKGLRILSTLSQGDLYVVIDEQDAIRKAWLEKLSYIRLKTCKGPHPAGNVGVHIHKLKPIKDKNDIVWSCDVLSVTLIGKLFSTGNPDPEVVIGVSGSSAVNRCYYKTVMGASLRDLLPRVQFETPGLRYISGNVLTGKNSGPDGFVGVKDTLITILPEPHKSRFLGWIMPGFTKMSRSMTFLSSWLPFKKKYSEPAALNGGRRAFIATGIYEEVLPMDILPVFLFKSIIAEEIEEMEKLGIYDVIEEDVALCEYIDPSKNEIQQLLRAGLDLIEKEG